MTVSSDLFKKGLASWASGVTLVTTRTGDGPAGLTASAFSSVSAEPPLVLVCINRASGSCARIREAGAFAVNILEKSQVEASNKFASSKNKDTRFDGLQWLDSPSGMPCLVGALASLDCRVVANYDQGSHCIYIGEVRHITLGEGQPLLYYKGAYREIAGL